MEDEGNASGPFFGFGESGSDPFVRLAEEGSVEFSLPFIPESPSFFVQFVLLRRESL
jgi:hypothetical protein